MYVGIFGRKDELFSARFMQLNKRDVRRISVSVPDALDGIVIQVSESRGEHINQSVCFLNNTIFEPRVGLVYEKSIHDHRHQEQNNRNCYRKADGQVTGEGPPL